MQLAIGERGKIVNLMSLVNYCHYHQQLLVNWIKVQLLDLPQVIYEWDKYSLKVKRILISLWNDVMNSKIGAAHTIASPFLQMNIKICFFFEQFTRSNNQIRIPQFIDYNFLRTTLLILLVICYWNLLIMCINLETLFPYYNKLHKT